VKSKKIRSHYTKEERASSISSQRNENQTKDQTAFFTYHIEKKLKNDLK
jgi:hypothetical protein